MHRLFVAIDLPDDIREMITNLCSGITGARWVPEDQLHLTLRFIGDTDDAEFSAIREALARIEGEPFPLAIRTVGHFPPGLHPRVLWVGLTLNEQLRKLQEEIESALATVAVPRETRRFSPHITIARLKETVLSTVESFETKNRSFTTKPFPVTEFHLYSSTLSNKGALHKREQTYPLCPPA